MANILVYIETRDERPLRASLEALGVGRQLASALGATNYALLPCTTRPSYDDDDAIAVLSRHGADKVILVTHPGFAGPTLDVTHGRAVVAACQALPPALVLFAATAGGRDLAPRLAARLASAYVVEPRLELDADGGVTLSRRIYGGRYVRRLHVQDLERPVVITLAPGREAGARGDEEAEVVVVPPPEAPEKFEEVAREPDAAPELCHARVVVGAGAGLGPEAYGVAVELAAALGGEAGITRQAALDVPPRRPEERIIDVAGRRIHPRLYVACAASGSLSHLGGVGAETLVAINHDVNAPIFEVAHYGLVADAREATAAIREALGRRD